MVSPPVSFADSPPRQRGGLRSVNMTEKSTLKKSATLAAAGLVVAGALLAGCGESRPGADGRCVRRQLGRDRRSRRKSSRNPSRTAPIAPTAPIPARRTTTVHHHVRQEGHRQLQGRQLLDQRPVRPGRRGFHRRPSDHQGRQRRDRQYHWAPVHHDFQEPSGRLRQSH